MIAEMVPGGAERIVVQLAAAATERGHEVHVATGGGAWEERLRATGASLHLVPFARRSPTETAGAVRALRRVIGRTRPDIIHSHNVRVTVAARAATAFKATRIPLVTTLHGLAPADYPGAARLLRFSTKTLVACAPAVGRAVRAAGFPASRLRVITNGAALAPASDDRREAARRRLGVNDRPLVLGIGRLVPQKSWSTLIAAASGLPEVDTVVIGEGELRDALEAEAEAAGGHVRFIGAVDDVAAAVGLAACVASSSTWEGLPLSLLEALSLGAPTVATAVDGIVDVVPHDAAVLVPPSDPAALAAAIDRVLHEPGLATALRTNATKAAAAWAPTTMLDAYDELYRELARR